MKIYWDDIWPWLSVPVCAVIVIGAAVGGAYLASLMIHG